MRRVSIGAVVQKLPKFFIMLKTILQTRVLTIKMVLTKALTALILLSLQKVKILELTWSVQFPHIRVGASQHESLDRAVPNFPFHQKHQCDNNEVPPEA